MSIYDYRVGDHRMTIAMNGDKINFIVINNTHLEPDEFERMYQIYLDFDEEGARERDESNAG